MSEQSTIEPAVQFKLLTYKWFRRTARLAGCDIFKENFKPTACTYFWIFVLMLFKLSCIYTIYSYEFSKKVVCASMFSFNEQGIAKFYGFIKNAKSIKGSIDFALKVYTSNMTQGLNKTCLEKSVKTTVLVFKVGVAFLIVAGIATLTIPFLSYLFTGHLDPIFPAYFPGVNEDETIGYIILATYHSIMCFIFVVGTAGVDLSLMTFVLHSYVLTEIFQNAVNDFNDKVKKNKRNKLEIRATLDNLILMHDDFSKYMKQLKMNYYEICLIQIMMANTAMCVLVYVILEMNWFSSYFLIATAFFQVFEFSLLGTIVEIVNISSSAVINMNKPLTMEPAVAFKLLMYKWFRKTAQLAGVDLFNENFKPTAYTYLLISILFLFKGSCIYTIYSYEFDRKVICASMFAFNMQGIIKYYGYIKNAKSIKKSIDFALKVYKSNMNPSQNRICLEKSVKTTVIVFKAGVIFIIIAGLQTSIMPFILYFFTGHLDPILPAYLPGINEDETFGYVILASLHLMMCFIFVIGTVGVDLSLMVFVLHSYVLTQIFENGVNDLNQKVKKVKNKLEIRATVDNLILMHDDFLRYMKQLKTNFYEICLIQIMMANTVMCVLVYVVLEMNWVTAYFLIATAFLQVFEYSVLGTIIEIVNDRVYNSIICISFPNLPTTEQKKVILMTLMAQRPHNLTLGGIRELNVTTFISSMKTTYSVAMLLVSSKN